ncbi:MAG: nucleotidyl transferase AbiEii/AbiGii toxin family protein [Verrucomicrobia bacterium]|nr:nucleotidyl transferase AbiEii/AbiGii toxin family protein [Verrucomicrobiota bacterium]
MNRIEQINRVFDTIGRKIPEAGVRFLLIGGHAVNHYGYTRATMDVDFMIAAEDVPTIRKVMKTAGFSNVSEGKTVIFFSNPESPLRIDFLPVDSNTMQQLLKGSVKINYGGADLSVPCLNDLLAMKLFALKNGSSMRRDRDFYDVVQLVIANGLDTETDLKPLCERFATATLFKELSDRIREMKNV